MPLVDVAIPAYNCAGHLKDSVQSILLQRDIGYELGVILVDDGSTDNTWEICEALAATDKRVRAFRNPHNQGISATLNRCLNLSTARYFARMDADDIALPSRISTQVAAMIQGKFALCGTAMTLFGVKKGHAACPRRADDYAATLLFRPPFGHPTAVMDRERMERSQIRYSDSPVRQHTEDYGLWIDFFLAGEHCTCLKQPLVLYRVHPHSISHQHAQLQRSNALALSFGLWEAMGFSLPPVQRTHLQQSLVNPPPLEQHNAIVGEALAEARAGLARTLAGSLWGRSEFINFCTRFFPVPTNLAQGLTKLHTLAPLDAAGCAAFLWRHKILADPF